MFKFSIGYNGSKGFEQILRKYRERVSDVYFAPPYASSGRVKMGFVDVEYPVLLDRFLRFCRSEGIEANLLMNALCGGADYASRKHITKVVGLLGYYRDKYAVSSVTLVSPFDAQIIRKEFPDIKIYSSVNMFIRNPVQAREAAAFADVLTLDRTVNRDLETLHKIRRELPGKHIRLLANEGCIFDCVNRVQHFNQICHLEPPVGPQHLFCLRTFLADKAAILKSPIIRPEDLHHYEGLADSIKLATRTQDDTQLEVTLQAYVSGRFHGDLFDILESDGMAAYLEHCRRQAQGTNLSEPFFANDAIPDDFFQKVTSCDKLCDNCNYCNQIAERAFTLGHAAAGGINVQI